MKRNLLLAAFCAVTFLYPKVCWADDVFKDVTSTYLTNANFEGDYSVYKSLNDGDRALYEPSDWAVEKYENGNKYDMSALGSGCLQWTETFSNKIVALSGGGDHTYWIRFNSGQNQRLTIKQSTSSVLPKGTYQISADWYVSVTNKGDGYIIVNNGSSDDRTNNGTAGWSRFSKSYTTEGAIFTLTFGAFHSSKDSEKLYAFDNFVLEWNLTKSLNDLITEANSFIEGEEDSYSTLQSAIDAADAVKGSTDASTLETQYNALATALDLAKNHRKLWLTAWTTANTNYASVTYANVTGSEKTALKTEIDKSEPSTADDYDSAKTALESANSYFTEAKDSYDGLAAARTAGATYTTELWPRASLAKKTALDNAVGAAAPTNATDAVTKTNAIVTAYRQFVESNGLAEGVAVAVDYTNTYLAGADPDVNTGWTNGIGTDARSEQIYTKGDGTQGGRYYDGGYSTSDAVNINMTRELTLPAGEYQLQITARGSADLTSYTMSIGEVTVNLPTEGDGAAAGTFGHGWSDKFVVFNSDGTTSLTLAIVATSTDYQQWISFNRLRLVKLDATLADATDYSNLNSAIAAAEAKNVGFEDGEYAPYNNVDALAKLAEAKAIDQDANNVQEDVQALTTYLNTATNWTINDGEVNAVFDGTFANAENNGAPAGWTMSNNTLGGDKHSRAFVGDERLSEFNATNSALFLRFDGTNSTRGSLYYYGKIEGYTMPLKSDTYYRLTVDFAGWGSKGKPLRLNVDGPAGFEAVYCDINTSVQADTEDKEPQRFDIIFYASVAGNYQIYFQTPGSNANTHMVVVSNIELFKCPAASATMTVKANKWGTFIAPFDVTIPSGVNAYTVTGVAGTNIKKSVAIATTIPANTPVILENTTESQVEQAFNGQNLSQADSYTVGILTGVYTAATIAASVEPGAETEGAYRYVLQTQGDKQGFYKVESAFTATANRCYLTVPVAATGGSGVKAFYFDFGDATGVNTVQGSGFKAQDSEIYNLAGQRMSKAQGDASHLKKGIYIVNGKKVLVK